MGGNEYDSASVALILDVDNTLLKEVANTYRHHESVQILHYRPAPASLQEYRNILSSPPYPGKVIHYEAWDDDTIISTVVVRPNFQKLLDGLHSAGCRLLLVSANDEERTKAVQQQVRVKGITLADWGFQIVPREVVVPVARYKDVAAVRAWARLEDSVLGVVMADTPEEFTNLSPADHVVGVAKWDRRAADAYLQTGAVVKLTTSCMPKL
eukprot:gene6535-7831_t